MESNLYNIKFEHRPTYLYAYITGTRKNHETSLESWKIICRESKENNYKKILVERKVDGLGTLPELQEMFNIILSDLKSSTLAIIDSDPNHYQTLRLAATFISNKGVHIKFFNSIGEAKEWLLLQ